MGTGQEENAPKLACGRVQICGQAVQCINEILTIGDGFIISDGVTIEDISVILQVITDHFFDTALE